MSDSNFDTNNYEYNFNEVYTTPPNPPENDDREKEALEKRKRRYWFLIILLFVIGLLSLFCIRYLCCQNKQTKARYEEYIKNSRDSFLIVVADLNGKIDSLEAAKSRLTGTIRAKDSKIGQLRRLVNTYNPEKLKAAQGKIKELQDYIVNLEAQIQDLKAENDALANDNKLLRGQIDEWKNKYDELYNNYIACCKDGAKLSPDGKKKITAPGATPEDELPADDDYQVVAENAALNFEAFDKKGNLITAKEKITAKDIQTFLVTFDAKSTRAADHMFYVRVTDSIEGNLVVPSNYATTGKKILKLPDGEELPYTFSLPYKFEKANEFYNIASKFNPDPRQIRYLPYRVEIYDSKGKYTEGYAIPSTGKKDRKKAKWIW